MNLRREAITSSDYWDFQPGERVMTIDGYPGVVELVEDGPIAGAENYVVTLDNGLGGGNYSASMLSKMPTARSAAGIHLATDDYPELGTVIDDRPDPGKMTFTAAALSQERLEADAEDHDEPGGDDQPHSCSYCGSDQFKDLTDNGRVRQATCAVCNGTMSAHPGAQWTPELIGDPSNHPKAIVDPRSGASPGAGAPGQAGINDFIDFNSRASTTAAKIPSATCATCKGSGTVSWSDEDPDWDGDPDENPGKVHTAPCDDCGGKGITPETSDEELAAARKRFEQRLTESTAKHVQEKHPAGKLVTIDDVRGCGPRCPVGREWDRQRKPFHYEGSLNHTLLHIAGIPAVTARNWAFNHHEQETGGTKFPVKHQLHAHDPETRISGGQVDYFPPKRKGGPVHIDNLSPSLNTPGAGSAMMNEIQRRHPDSTIKFLHEQKRDQNTPSHRNSAHGEPTDWDIWHAGVKDDGIHRGFAVRLEPHHAETLNDPTKSKAEHLQALHEAMPEGHKMGMHWTTNEQRATSFAHSSVMDPRRDIPVVLHAKGPERKDIEDRPEHLFRNGVFPYDHVSKEREVPIRRGRKVEVTGMSWKPDAEHPDADRDGWVHHTYADGETKRHTALREQQEPDAEAMLRTAARDRDFGFHVTASWADVQRKAKRIRAEGGVTIVIASHDGIGGTVQGDHGTYEALLVYRPGTRKVADWTCGCKWAAYAFDRSPGFQRYEGRKCSHALALQFEAQSQGMFGKEVHPSEPTSRERTIVRYDPDADEHVFARPYEGSLIGSLVARLRESDADPAEVIGNLIRAGMKHRTAVLLWKSAEHEEGGERRCPHCGGFIGVEAVEHHRCPHCGAPLGGEGHQHHHEGAKQDPPGPKVSGVALKAHDTGRVLMLQRGLDDEKDPAAGTWEFPGGHHEEGDLSSLHAGIREWEEEVGQQFPTNGAVKHVWTSPNGVYQGHVVVIPSEKDLSMKDGRVVPNPDDPKGDCHEQAAWWDPEHARKIPNLRDEVKAHTPWKEIAKASLDTAKAASAWDPISNTNPQPGRGTSAPAHSNTTNPGSTGWAASEDPDNWNNLNANPEPLTPSLGFDAALHDEPEPALPVAYGDEDATMRPAEFTHADLDPIPDNPPAQAELVPDSDANIHLLDGGSALPNTYHASVESEAEGDRVAAVVAAFQKSAAGQALMTEPEGDGNDDIAAAARAHLEKTAAKQFDFAEQQELITEGQNDGRRARNLASLRIKGTHYELLEAAFQGEAADSTDLFI